MIDPKEREEAAMSLFHEGYNCCQSVVLAFADIVKERTGLDEEQIKAVCSGFGGGFGRMREVCGSVSGMTFLAGAVCPAGTGHSPSRMANYALVQELAGAFREANGSIVCRELLGLRQAAAHPGQQTAPRDHTAVDAHGFPLEGPKPSERTEEYYKVRPCERLVGCAARIFAERFNKEFLPD